MSGKDIKKIRDGQPHAQPRMNINTWETGTSILFEKNLQAAKLTSCLSMISGKVPLAPECSVGGTDKCLDQTPALRFPHYLNSSLSVPIYKMGSIISGSKLSGHKECYFWA